MSQWQIGIMVRLVWTFLDPEILAHIASTPSLDPPQYEPADNLTNRILYFTFMLMMYFLNFILVLQWSR